MGEERDRTDAVVRQYTPGNTADDTLLADMLYDCGNRRMRVVFTNNDTLNGTTDYYYHGWRVYEERDGSGAITWGYQCNAYGILSLQASNEAARHLVGKAT